MHQAAYQLLELQELQPMLVGETWYFEHRQHKLFKQKICEVFLKCIHQRQFLAGKFKHRNAQDHAHSIPWVLGQSQKHHMLNIHGFPNYFQATTFPNFSQLKQS